MGKRDSSKNSARSSDEPNMAGSEAEPTDSRDGPANVLSHVGAAILGLPRSTQIALAVSVIGFCVAYWPAFVRLWSIWNSNPQYSHGFLVPVMALGIFYMLWGRHLEEREEKKDFVRKTTNQPGFEGARVKFDSESFSPSGWGFLFLIMGIALKVGGVVFYVDFFDYVSMLAFIGAGVLFVGGRTLARITWPVVAFLIFMMPMPYRVEHAAADPLQKFAARASTYLLQTVGFPAIREGNIIVIEETRLGVEEACSGLRMLMVFFALSAAVAIVSEKPLWERCFVLFSAVPIALASNILRIITTGVLHGNGWHDAADTFHLSAGWLMMVPGLLFLWIELFILSRLLIEPERHRPLPLAGQTPA